MCPLHHPNLVLVHGGVWNEGADKLCIVLEFCGQGSIRTFFRRSPSLNASQDTSWAGLRHGLALGTAKGLSYLHHDLAEPLIHRDIKPDNILVGRSKSTSSTGHVAKLADFGESTHFNVELAKAEADDAGDDALTMTMVGTKLYCAPEIMMRQRYNESVAREHS